MDSPSPGQKARQEIGPGSAEGVEAAAGRADCDALARVVVESVNQLTQADQLPLGGVEPFLAIARRRRGEPFSADPVARELVEEALLEFFGRKDARAVATWRWLGMRVSATLCKDAASQKVLARFWSLLQQAGAEK